MIGLADKEFLGNEIAPSKVIVDEFSEVDLMNIKRIIKGDYRPPSKRRMIWVDWKGKQVKINEPNFEKRAKKALAREKTKLYVAADQLVDFYITGRPDYTDDFMTSLDYRFHLAAHKFKQDDTEKGYIEAHSILVKLFTKKKKTRKFCC